MEQLSTDNIRLEWDSKNKREIEDCKKFYQQAKREKREITLLDGSPVVCFKPEYESLIIKKLLRLKENQIETQIIDETGDRRVIWDATNPKEIDDSCALFNEYIAKGWRAYAIGDDGKRARRIYGFKADTQEVLFEEGTVKEKLKDFARSFREVKMAAKTLPD